ncbi:MAG: Rab family GTPase [Candidatus Sericytochromatia bacterium]
MIQKKICLVGAFAVGKTSLIQRYVKSIFSEKYITTIGVKVDKKELVCDGSNVNLVIWDLNGTDEIDSIKVSYLRGSSGYLLVADCSRVSTIDTANEIINTVNQSVGNIPFILLLNKMDLIDDFTEIEAKLSTLNHNNITVLKTSAKTGEGVENAFLTLTKILLDKK